MIHKNLIRPRPTTDMNYFEESSIGESLPRKLVLVISCATEMMREHLEKYLRLFPLKNKCSAVSAVS